MGAGGSKSKRDNFSAKELESITGDILKLKKVLYESQGIKSTSFNISKKELIGKTLKLPNSLPTSIGPAFNWASYKDVMDKIPFYTLVRLYKISIKLETKLFNMLVKLETKHYKFMLEKEIKNNTYPAKINVIKKELDNLRPMINVLQAFISNITSELNTRLNATLNAIKSSKTVEKTLYRQESLINLSPLNKTKIALSKRKSSKVSKKST